MDTNDPKPSQGAPTVLPLRRLPLWTSGLTFLACTAAVFVLRALVDVGPHLWAGDAMPSEVVEAVGIIALFLTLVGAVLGKRLIVRLRPLPPVSLYDDHMELPPGPEATFARRVAYGDIVAVNEGGRGPRRAFFIESHRQVFYLPQEIFHDTDGPERLFFELRRRIHNLPQGTRLLEQTERRRMAAMRAMTRQPLCTHAILGVLVVFFVNALAKGDFDTPFGLVRWGANAPSLVAEGQWWRLVAANFLHGGYFARLSMGILHLSLNGIAIYYLGNLLERLLGWQRFVSIYLLSGIAAMAASAWYSDAVMSVGASGAVFGLLGTFAALNWRLRAQLPLGLRQPLRWWLVVLVINATLPLMWPGIDVAAHLGGFVSGGLLGMIFLGRARALPPRPGPVLTGLAATVVGLAVVALGLAVRNAATRTQADETAFVTDLVAATQVRPNTLNRLAWEWAIDPRTDAESLALANTAARRAVLAARQGNTQAPIGTHPPAGRLPEALTHPDLGVGLAEFEDTLAVVMARLGDRRAAIAGERHALALQPDATLFATRLAAWLTEVAEKDGAVLTAPGVGGASVRLAIDAAEPALVLEAFPNLPHAADLYAVLACQGRQVALVRLSVGAHIQTPQRHTPELLPALMQANDKQQAWHVVLGLVDDLPGAVPAAGEARWSVLPVLGGTLL